MPPAGSETTYVIYPVEQAVRVFCSLRTSSRQESLIAMQCSPDVCRRGGRIAAGFEIGRCRRRWNACERLLADTGSAQAIAQSEVSVADTVLLQPEHDAGIGDAIDFRRRRAAGSARKLLQNATEDRREI